MCGESVHNAHAFNIRSVLGRAAVCACARMYTRGREQHLQLSKFWLLSVAVGATHGHSRVSAASARPHDKARTYRATCQVTASI